MRVVTPQVRNTLRDDPRRGRGVESELSDDQARLWRSSDRSRRPDRAEALSPDLQRQHVPVPARQWGG